MATKWYSLGLQLLDDSGILDTIRSTNPTDVECCCTEIKPDANWGQLITALNDCEIGLKAAVDCVTTYTFYYNTLEWSGHDQDMVTS